MIRHSRDALRWLAVAAILALPVGLVWSAAATVRQLTQQRAVYLQSRAAALAGRLESLPATIGKEGVFDLLAEEERSLVDFSVIERGSIGDSPDLQPLWEGKTLYRSDRVMGSDGAVRRFWVPFHFGDQIQVARLDLAESSADFLVQPALRNLWISLTGGITLFGLLGAVLWTSRRNTRLEARQREMEHLARLGQMSAVLAHEIRNPLGAVKGFVQLAQEEGNGSVRNMLTPALGEIARLERLVSDLLLYGRPPKPSFEKVRWAEIVDILGRGLTTSAGPDRVRLTMDAAGHTLRTDRNLLVQALLNLTRNAAEAVEKTGGEVRVSLRHEPGWFVICISDDGPGFSQEARKRMFEPFFTTKASGTGLGLSITRKLIEALGGTLEYGAPPRGGAEWFVRLPSHELKES
jgi:two-component system sensor histidine kinase HydH